VLAAPSVSVPPPDFSRVVIGVTIASDTVTLPTPVNVIADAVDAVNAVPEPDTLNVRVPASLAIVVAAPSVIAPVTVLRSSASVARLRIAPLPPPVPDTVIGSAIDKPVPLRCTAAPLDITVFSETDAEPPSDEFAVSTTTPAVIEVDPV